MRYRNVLPKGAVAPAVKEQAVEGVAEEKKTQQYTLSSGTQFMAEALFFGT